MKKRGLQEKEEADFDEESDKRSAREAHQEPVSTRAIGAAGEKTIFFCYLFRCRIKWLKHGRETSSERGVQRVW